MNNKPRFFEISLLNVFLCLSVIFIHVSSKPITVLDVNSMGYLAAFIPWRLASFVVYGFIFLSGCKLLLSKSNNFSYGKFLVSRLVSIVIPYIIWVFIYYIYFWHNNYFAFKFTDLIRYIFIGDLVSHFYFIIIIVQFYLLAPLWIKLVKKINESIALPVSLILTVILGANLPDILNIAAPNYIFPYADRVFTTYLFYWTAGCYAGLYYEKFKAQLLANRIFIAVFFAVSAAGNVYFSYLKFTGRSYISWLDNIHTMYCMSAILFFFTAAVSLNKSLMIGVINKIDRVSYSIYLGHCLIIFIADDILLKFVPGLPMKASYPIRIFAVYTVVILAALIWYHLKNFLSAKIPVRPK